MMNFLGNVVWLVMTLTVVIIFLCVSVVGLAVLDYALDSDIKGALVRTLGPRHFLKRLRLRLLQICKKVDTPEPNDIPAGMDEYMGKPGADYDEDINRLLNLINNTSFGEKNE